MESLNLRCVGRGRGDRADGVGNMQKLLLATQNPGKLREFQELLRDLGAPLVTLRDLDIQVRVREDGTTYAENAAIKAIAYHQASGLLSIADDSGLEVQLLDGKPGLYSARFAPGPNATDADRRLYLLEQLRGHPRPWRARFRCVVAIAASDRLDEVRFTEGVVAGEISPEERGAGGFGYDPIFLIAGLGQTMAEIDPAQKNKISHRARAFRAARPILWELLDR